MFVQHSGALESEPNETSCSDLSSCTKCTVKARCSWSLEQQSCIKNAEFHSTSLIVSDITKCPRFSVVKKYKYFNQRNITYHYSIKVANDSVGFMNFLSNKKMSCGNKNRGKFGVEIKEDEIICPPLFFEFIIFKFFRKQSFIKYVATKFNDVTLRLDNVVDHFVTFYEHESCANDNGDQYCATCGWNKDKYLHYLQWCSSKNTCKSQKHKHMNSIDDGRSEFNYLSQINEKAYVANDCAEINVTAVDPLNGPRAGGTVMTITVRNHWILAENGMVTVTVAGTECANPRTSGRETITCTTSPPVNATTGGIMSGPVRVEYSSTDGGSLTVESSQTFQFLVCGTPRPVIDAHQQLSGAAAGGTAVPLRGGHFVEPCVVSPARMYVDLPNGDRQFADGYCDQPVNDTYMVCPSPRANVTGWDASPDHDGWLLEFGLDVINFTARNQSFYVDGPPSLGFHVQPERAPYSRTPFKLMFVIGAALALVSVLVLTLVLFLRMRGLLVFQKTSRDPPLLSAECETSMAN